MLKVTQLLREDLERKKRYFKGAEAEIAEKNLRLIEVLSLVTAAILLTFFALTPVIIPGWTMTIQHFLMLPASLLLCAGAELGRRRKASPRAVTWMCLLFESVLFIFIILIDVFQAPDVPASFMPLLCVALPTLLILPLRISYSVMLVFEIIFIVVVTIFKIPAVGRYDIFNALAGTAFSVAVAQTVMHLRLQDYDVRMRYEQLSTQDTLSDILNKKAAVEAVKHYLRGHNPHVVCALLILDIDDFKLVNDRLGHYTGDILLRAIGELLGETFRSTDVIGRFGGDEFLVLVKNTADQSVLEVKCQTVRERLFRSAALDGDTRVTCSIGCVLADGQEVSSEELFRPADSALYDAKAAGKNRYELRNYQQTGTAVSS